MTTKEGIHKFKDGIGNVRTIMVDVVRRFPDVRQDHVVFSKSLPEHETSASIHILLFTDARIYNFWPAGVTILMRQSV